MAPRTFGIELELILPAATDRYVLARELNAAGVATTNLAWLRRYPLQHKSAAVAPNGEEHTATA